MKYDMKPIIELMESCLLKLNRLQAKMKVSAYEIEKFSDVEFSDIDHSDRPNYSDAYIVFGVYDGIELTPEDIEAIQDEGLLFRELLKDYLN